MAASCLKPPRRALSLLVVFFAHALSALFVRCSWSPLRLSQHAYRVHTYKHTHTHTHTHTRLLRTFALYFCVACLLLYPLLRSMPSPLSGLICTLGALWNGHRTQGYRGGVTNGDIGGRERRHPEHEGNARVNRLGDGRPLTYCRYTSSATCSYRVRCALGRKRARTAGCAFRRDGFGSGSRLL